MGLRAHWPGPASRLVLTGFIGPGPAACVHGRLPVPASSCPGVCRGVPARFSATFSRSVNAGGNHVVNCHYQAKSLLQTLIVTYL